MSGAPPRGVFGYGSLMNAATHDHAGLRPARLAGWRRLWRHAAGRPAAFLTVEPAPGASVEGAMAEVAPAAWPALDAREAAYERHEVSGAVTAASPLADSVADSVVVYAVPTDRQEPASLSRPVLLSYLDVVVQGAMRLHGAAGAAAFFDTTGGWAVVLDDRAAPRYVRAQALSPDERAAVDEGLARLGVALVGAQGQGALVGAQGQGALVGARGEGAPAGGQGARARGGAQAS